MNIARTAAQPLHILTTGLLAASAAGGIAVLVGEAGAPTVLVLMLGAVGAGVVLARPDWATLLTAFLLYVNLPAILTKEHGLPGPVAGGVILLFGVRLVHRLVIERRPPRVDWTLGLMVAYLAFMLLSTLAAVDTSLALNRVFEFVAEGLLLYFLVINAVTDLAMLRRVFWVLLAAAALVSTLCLYQDVTGSYTQEFGGLAHRNYEASDDSSNVEVVRRRRTWDRAQGPVDEPNRFAQVLIVLVPLAMFLFRNAATPLQRLAAAGLGGLTLMGAGLTLSRGGILTLALLALAMARIRWVRTLQLAAGAAVMVVVFSAVSPFFVSRMLSIVNAGHLLGDDQFSHQQADGAMRGRLTEMLAALHVFMDHPVIGVGPSQFARYYFVDYAGNAGIKFREINVPRRAHSLFFELGAEQGVLGLAGFSVLVGGLMWKLWRGRRRWLGRDLERADLAAALTLSLFAYLATGFFLHLSYQRYFWLLVALGSAALHVVTSREREPRPSADGRGGNRLAAVGETTR